MPLFVGNTALYQPYHYSQNDLSLSYGWPYEPRQYAANLLAGGYVHLSVLTKA